MRMSKQLAFKQKRRRLYVRLIRLVPFPLYCAKILKTTIRSPVTQMMKMINQTTLKYSQPQMPKTNKTNRSKEPKKI